MTVEQRLERDLPQILGDLSIAPYPDYIDDVLATTAQRRQRPAWTFPERWIPMDLVTERVPTARLPWRQFGVLALIALMLATALAVYVGSRQRLPVPYGLAANGFVAIDRGGDLYVADPSTGAESLLLGGPTHDEWLGFSRDGTRAVFLRWDAEQRPTDDGRLAVMMVEGGDVTIFDGITVTKESWLEYAPDGRTVAIHTRVDGRFRIAIVDLDGGTVRVLDEIDVSDVGSMAFLAPDGEELVFVSAQSRDGTRRGIAAVHVTSGRVRTIVPGSMTDEVVGNLSASPDGKSIAYARQTSATGETRVHIVGVDGSHDRVVGHADGAIFEAWPQWSPSGRYLLLERIMGESQSTSSEAVPIVLEVETGREVPIQTTISSNGAGKEWAPDESAILAQRTEADGTRLPHELWDIANGAVTPAPWSSTSMPLWQRKAPTG